MGIIVIIGSIIFILLILAEASDNKARVDNETVENCESKIKGHSRPTDKIQEESSEEINNREEREKIAKEIYENKSEKSVGEDINIIQENKDKRIKEMVVENIEEPQKVQIENSINKEESVGNILEDKAQNTHNIIEQEITSNIVNTQEIKETQNMHVVFDEKPQIILGERVVNYKFGIGTIIAIQEDIIKVLFDNKIGERYIISGLSEEDGSKYFKSLESKGRRVIHNYYGKGIITHAELRPAGVCVLFESEPVERMFEKNSFFSHFRLEKENKKRGKYEYSEEPTYYENVICREHEELRDEMMRRNWEIRNGVWGDLYDE